MAQEASTRDRDCEVKVVQQARVCSGVVCVLAQVCHCVPPFWGGGICWGGRKEGRKEGRKGGKDGRKESGKVCNLNSQEQIDPAIITPWWRSQRKQSREQMHLRKWYIPGSAGEWRLRWGRGDLLPGDGRN